MKRAWQVWLLYGLCLIVALPALSWLTVNAVDLERAETQARARGQREEQIRLALWRMDTKLGPLIAQETARPYYDYASFYPGPGLAGGPSDAAANPSPLLVQPSEYVLLNFQIFADGNWTSPQCPPEPTQRLALDRGATSASIRISAERMAMLRHDVHYADLLARLPRQTLPPIPLLPGSKVALLGGPPESNDLKRQFQSVPIPPTNAKKIDDDFLRRQAVNSSSNFMEVVQQRAKTRVVQQPSNVLEGVCRPIWIGQHLLLARRVTIERQLILQGCWLDWEKLRHELQAEVVDLIPRFELRPVSHEGDVDYAHSMATLPVQLIAPELDLRDSELTPLRASLFVAWSGLIVAAAAIGILLKGVVTLSQRREAFVSAVTHELRTPLTTFRVYAQMLEENMVSGEAQRKDYLHTLRVEADRLSHLVENVLAYARLERGPRHKQRQRFLIDELWARVESRLSDHAKHAGMELALEVEDGLGRATLWTDPTAVEQILFNLVDNARKYASSAAVRTIHVQVKASERNVEIHVRDHGSGIAPRDARRLFRPFSKSSQQAANSAPGVGLGLALCRRLARQMGGDLRFEDPGVQGASFVLVLPRE